MCDDDGMGEEDRTIKVPDEGLVADVDFIHGNHDRNTEANSKLSEPAGNPSANSPIGGLQT